MRLFLVKPQILLMDEQFSALDTFTRRELDDEVQRIRHKMKTTILLVTHNPEEAVYLAERIVIRSKRQSVVLKNPSCRSPAPRGSCRSRLYQDPLVLFAANQG